MKIRETSVIVSQERLCEGVYSMWLATGIAKHAKAGQFVSVYSNSDARLLPRPISICEIDDKCETGRLRLVYRVAGAGTEEFSKMREGDTLTVMGPLGNGFISASSGTVKPGMKALLIGGGIGIPPMVAVSASLPCNVVTVAGYRSAKEMFLTNELEKSGLLFVSTDDGSAGTGGNVIDAVNENGIRADIIFACGPKPMLRGVKELSEKWNVPAFISMEERMACGIGACLGCVCTTTAVDDHSKVKNKRICVDGPVFPASEVEL